MKNLLLLVAVGCLALVLAAPAQAQFYPSYGSPGGYAPSYGGYPSGYGAYTPSYGSYRSPHLDYHPGGFVPHRGHYHYVPPHTDLHIGGRQYEIRQGLFGPRLSPVPHHHH